MPESSAKRTCHAVASLAVVPRHQQPPPGRAPFAGCSGSPQYRDHRLRTGAGTSSSVSGENITVLCDERAEPRRSRGQVSKARRTTDFRRLSIITRSSTPSVVSTCEHTHAFAIMPALAAGKHVYCEKPLTHGIWERGRFARRRPRPRSRRRWGFRFTRPTTIAASSSWCGGVIGPVREVRLASRAGLTGVPKAAKKNSDIVSTQDRPKGESRAKGARLGALARTGAHRPFLTSISRAEMVSLVGLRQRHR